jgi:enediyne biosynthesis protein E4
MKNKIIFLLTLLLLSSCNPEGKKGDTLFTILPPSYTHVDFKNQLTENEEFNIIEYLYFNNGAGVAAGDINNDGLVDLYFTANQESNKLYLNKGNLEFVDITDNAGVSGKGNWKTGVTMADVNGDGFLDIYICQVGAYKSFNGRNQLFINQGNLKFQEEAEAYNLDFQGFSTQAAFFDYDIDGDLDMYLLNHSVHTSRSYGPVSLRNEFDPRAGDRLFRNDEKNGKRFFTDVTRQAGIHSSQIGYGLGVNISDINNDGYPDIYVSNDFHENDYLYINNGDYTFSERLTEYIGHTTRSSMGNDIGDINNDGLMDIIVLDMLPDKEKIRKQSGGEDDFELSEIKKEFGYNNQFVRNNLQLNLGGGLFSEIGLLAGIFSTDWSWSPLFCDLDNDGWKDLFITSGIFRRANDLDYVKFLTGGNRFFPSKDNSNIPDKGLYEKMPLYPNVNYLYKNNRDLTFSNENKTWGSGPESYSNGAAYADLDNDGDLDIVVNNINEQAYIYRNNAGKHLSNHYVSIRLKGKGLNKLGTGARVTLFHDGLKQVGEQFSTRGFMSSTSCDLHFGLGSSTIIDSIIVRWPDLSKQLIKEVNVDKVVTFDYENAVKQTIMNTSTGENLNLFSRVRIPGLEFRHKEDGYVDFNREKLIPHSLSAEGPALAVGDVNGDNLDDLLAGGAKGQAAILFIQQKDGTFRKTYIPILLNSTFADIVDASFFDADNDGDPDLYVVHGGNEIPAGNQMLNDLLLINDGKGGFISGELPLVSHNGSCVRPCDFDNDGDVDLFVGSRSVPGAYGWSPDQFLLENNGKGIFRDVTDIRMKDLKNAGMVTDADWTDYDKDGDPDLIVTGEWMKICIFRNENGIFTDSTTSAGLGETSGWWYSIHVADIDQDGDMDIIGGNLGLNSILKATPDHPVDMYLNDFDNNGSLDQIICAYENGISYPVASLDEIAAQISGFEKNFPNYSDFGGKTVVDIFGKSKVDQSTRKEAVLFESCVFLNNGEGTFTIKKLPLEAQFAPVRDIMISDINMDGTNDLILAGNNYTVRPSYGRYDASYGWFLAGDSLKGFITMMPVESGLIIKGDARKILPLKVLQKNYVVVAVNDAELQLFEIQSGK